jgi:hypothetical protein
MAYKIIEQMSFSEIKKEIIDSREKNDEILKDLNTISDTINKFIEKYKGGEQSEQIIIPLQLQQRTKKQEILSIVNEKGSIYTGDLITELMNRKIIGKDDNSVQNVRTIISKMKYNGELEKNDAGMPLRLPKQ